MTDKFRCNFCKREFIREKSLINHLCEMKRRWDNCDEKYVQIGFNTWLKWYELSGTNINNNKKYSYDDFMRGKYYIAFVKFGKHVLDTKMLNPTQFISFVIKNHIRLDDWRKDSVYEAYVRDVCKREDVETALERYIQIIIGWARENDEIWTDFFANVHPNEALKLIRNGRISPWVILNSTTIYKLFDRMSEEQISLINDFIDLKSWKVRMLRNEEDRQFVNNILEENEI